MEGTVSVMQVNTQPHTVPVYTHMLFHTIPIPITHAHTPINHKVKHALAETVDQDELLPRSVCIMIC